MFTYSAIDRTFFTHVELSTRNMVPRVIGVKSENLNRNFSCPGTSTKCIGTFVNDSPY